MGIFPSIGLRAAPWTAIYAISLFSSGSFAWPRRGVEVRFSATRPTVSLGEPVYVEFSVSNGLSTAVRFNLGADRKEQFQFTIIRPDRSKVEVPRLRRGGVARIGDISLPPGGKYQQTLVLNEWYQFPAHGDYQVEAIFAGCVQTGPGISVECNHSETTSLQITPRDPKRLAEVSESLANTAVESADVGVAGEAAQTLSNIEDLIAVPFLAEVATKRPYLRDTAIAGLARIANNNGLAAVMSCVRERDLSIELSVKSALKGIQSGSTPAD